MSSKASCRSLWLATSPVPEVPYTCRARKTAVREGAPFFQQCTAFFLGEGGGGLRAPEQPRLRAPEQPRLRAPEQPRLRAPEQPTKGVPRAQSRAGAGQLPATCRHSRQANAIEAGFDKHRIQDFGHMQVKQYTAEPALCFISWEVTEAVLTGRWCG